MVSNSAELRSFLLTICILDPESTTNSLSSCSLAEALGRTHFSASEKNVALSFAFELVFIFGQIPSLALGTSFVSFCLFVGPTLDFDSVRTSLMSRFDLYVSKRWSFLFPDTRVTLRGLRESNSLNCVQDFLDRVSPKLFRSLRSECIRVLWYTTQLWYAFRNSHSAFVFTYSFWEVAFLRPLIWLFTNLVMRKQTRVSWLTTRFLFCFSKKAHWDGCHYSQGVCVQVPCKQHLHGCRRMDPWLLLPRILIFLDTLLPRERAGSEGVAAVRSGFCTRCWISRRKLQRSPCEIWPLSFHW